MSPCTVKAHYRPLRAKEMVGRACLPAYLGSVSLFFFATIQQTPFIIPDPSACNLQWDRID